MRELRRWIVRTRRAAPGAHGARPVYQFLLRPNSRDISARL
jgi:hypothetical protein